MSVLKSKKQNYEYLIQKLMNPTTHNVVPILDSTFESLFIENAKIDRQTEAMLCKITQMQKNDEFSKSQFPLYDFYISEAMIKEVSTYTELVQFIFKHGGVVVADFSNNWCTPCKLIAPYLDSYRTQFDVAVARIDTDKSEELSTKFDIHAVPSFVLLKKASGEVTPVEVVVSAHVEKLKHMFQNAYNIKNNKN